MQVHTKKIVSKAELDFFKGTRLFGKFCEAVSRDGVFSVAKVAGNLGWRYSVTREMVKRVCPHVLVNSRRRRALYSHLRRIRLLQWLDPDAEKANVQCKYHKLHRLIRDLIAELDHRTVKLDDPKSVSKYNYLQNVVHKRVCQLGGVIEDLICLGTELVPHVDYYVDYFSTDEVQTFVNFVNKMQ